MLSGTAADLYAVWAQAGAILAVGSGGVLSRWNGSSFASAALPAAAGRTLRAVWGSAPASAWLAGDGGMMLRWNGIAATAVSVGSTIDLFGLWGSSASDVWAVGDGGRIFHYDGSSWSLHVQGSSLTTQSLRAITGRNAKDVFCAGDQGALLRYDGTSWTKVDSGSVAGLTALWATGVGEVVIAGQAATILRYIPQNPQL